MPAERKGVKYLLKGFKRLHLNYGYRERVRLAVQTREIQAPCLKGSTREKSTEKEESHCVQKSIIHQCC